MRTSSVWKGALSFGLVNINIELYSAVKSHSMGFNLLHAKCHTPINYKRVCPRCNKEVEWNEIEKGLKLEDGTYFIINKETLQKLRPEKTDYISIVEFVDVSKLDTIYLDQHYYIAPSKETDRAFFLFHVALRDSNKIAIGQFVLRDKQYVCAIRPYMNALLLTTLNYDYEIKKIKKLESLRVPDFTSAEIKLAEQLINKLTLKKFEIKKFKDDFAERLQKRIKLTSRGTKVTEIEKPKKTKSSEESQASLMKSLRESLNSSTRSVRSGRGK